MMCNRLLCGRGGIGLAKSLLESESSPLQQPSDTGPTSWCVCGNCREMDNPVVKNVCCGVTTCVTNYENFFALCIDHMVLTVAILNQADIRADPIDYSPASHHKAAYI